MLINFVVEHIVIDTNRRLLINANKIPLDAAFFIAIYRARF